MSKKYIEKNIIPKVKISDDGEILFNKKPLAKDGFTPFHNLEFKSQLSYGANGVVFVAINKTIKIEQLVKLCFVTDSNLREKALSEAKKNSTVKLSDTIARVYDVGIIEVSDENINEVVYSIMEFVEDSITLKEYLEKRNEFWNVLTRLSPSTKLLQHQSIFGVLFQESMNVAAYFIRSIAYLIKNDIRHGDLNPGNILICNSIFSSELLRDIKNYQDCNNENFENKSKLDYRSLKHYYSNYGIKGSIRVGEIDEDKLSVKLIDLGASNIKPSTIEKTNQRDSWLIYKTVYDLLSPLFYELKENIDLKNFFFFKEVEIEKNNAIKKLEYYFPFEQYSLLTDGKYITKSQNEIGIKDGKILIGSGTFECSDEMREELLSSKEIFLNNQILPHLFQDEKIEKDLMFVKESQYNGQIPYQMMATDILKIIGIFNIYYGGVYNGNEVKKGDILYKDIQEIIGFGTLDENGVLPNDNIAISPLFDFRFHEAANLLFRKNRNGKIWSNNLLFNFNYILDVISQ